MRVLIAPDKFKGAATAAEVAKALGEGFLQGCPSAEIQLCPLADGGDGTAAILGWHAGAAEVRVQVADPLGRKIWATYYYAADRKTSYLEMAEAGGLKLLSTEERNPLITNTYGVGELMEDALRRGAKHVVLGIGGSATCEAGLGMAAAFGLRMIDSEGNELSPIAENLVRIARLDWSHWSWPNDVTLEVACDVDNPLTGELGAARVYGPQKGAKPQQVEQLEQGLNRLREVWFSERNEDLQDIRGGGAAGGMGAGLKALFQARLLSGIELVMAQSGFDRMVEEVDLVLTGEGRLDDQTLQGKVVCGVCAHAVPKGIPVIAVCGSLEASPETMYKLGLTFATSILRQPVSLDEAMAQTIPLLRGIGQRLGNWYQFTLQNHPQSGLHTSTT